KTASAWARFREAASIAKAAVEASRVELAERSAKELESRLSKVRFEVPNIAGLALTIDGGDNLAGPALKVEIPLHPGEHSLKATAPDRLPLELKFTVGPNGDRKTIIVPPLAEGPKPIAPPVAQPTPKASPEPSGANPPQSGGWGAQRTAGVAIGAVG